MDLIKTSQQTDQGKKLEKTKLPRREMRKMMSLQILQTLKRLVKDYEQLYDSKFASLMKWTNSSKNTNCKSSLKKKAITWIALYLLRSTLYIICLILKLEIFNNCKNWNMDTWVLDSNMGFPGGLVVKKLPASAGNTGATSSVPEWVRSPEEGMPTHSGTLTWKIPWTEEPGRL